MSASHGRVVEGHRVKGAAAQCATEEKLLKNYFVQLLLEGLSVAEAVVNGWQWPPTRLGFFLVWRFHGCSKMELLQETRWEHGGSGRVVKEP